MVLSGWAEEEEADGAAEEGGGQRHLAAHLLLLNPVRAGAGAGLRGRAELRGPDQAEGCAAARMAGLPGP